MSKDLAVLVGAGGHAKVVLEAVWAMGTFEVVGLTDPSAPLSPVLGSAVLGGDDVLPGLRERGVRIAVLAVGENELRQRLGHTLRALGFSLPPIIHPQAFVAPSATIGQGSVVMARAVVGTSSSVREFAIINTGAIIDHDNVICEAAHVAPGCSLAGWVHVGARALIGVGSAIRPRITIGDDAVVGAGSAVVADVAERAWVGGVPARPLRPGSKAAH